MSWWTSLRDAIQSVASVAGNYFFPGSGIITSRLVSQGAQKMLGSPLGQMAMMGSGIYGGAQGNLGNYGKTWDAIAGAGDAPSMVEGGLYGSAATAGGPSLVEEGLYGGQSQRISPWSSMADFFKGGGSTAASKTAGATGAMPWGSPGNLMSMGGGLYGMYQANQLKKMAGLADPWGTGGGASMAGDQLKTLLSDPSGVTKLPGYEAGLQAVQRSMAAQGYQGSGNMMSALSKYGGDFYNNAVSHLSGLARTGGGQAGLPLQGTGAALDVAGRSLASLGYGVQMTQPGQLSPQQITQLRQQLGIQ